MVEAVWNGFLRLSLVACPVRLAPATIDAHVIRLDPLNSRTGNPVTPQFVDARTGDVVAADAVVRGYATGASTYVTVSDRELETLGGSDRNILEVAHFSPRDQVDRARLETSYYIYPDGELAADTLEAVRVAMRRAERDAIGYVRLGDRERMVLIQVHGAGLMLSTLRPPRVLEAAEFAERPEGAVPSEMIEIAETIIRRRALGADPNTLHDRYEDRLRSLLEQKTGSAVGQAPRAAAVAPPPRQAPPPPAPEPERCFAAPPPPPPEPEPVAAPPAPEPAPEPMVAAPPPSPEPEPEPEPIVAAPPPAPPEPEPEPEPVVAAPPPEPEPVVAAPPPPEPELEPEVAASPPPEPEPEPVVAAPPPPEPEPMVAAPSPETETEPVVASPPPPFEPQAEQVIAAVASAEGQPHEVGTEILLHIMGLGDRRFVEPGWAGHPGSRRQIEAMSIRPREELEPSALEFRVFAQEGRATAWVSNGNYAGTRGRQLPLTGFAVRPAAELRDRFDILYEGCFFDGGVIGPKRNGEICTSPVANDPLEAVRVTIIERTEGGAGL
jgi:Ku protein